MTTTTLRLVVAVNPSASFGGHPETGDKVIAALRQAGHQVTALAEQSYVRLVDAVTAALAEGGQDALVVVGGDGMVHLGANLVAGIGVALAVVPTGTGNDLARGLGIPFDDIDAALAGLLIALQGRTRAIDAIKVKHAEGETWAAGTLSAGLDSLVNERANLMRRPRGKSRYTIALVIEILRLKRRKYSLVVDGVPRDAEAVLIAVANNVSIGGGMKIVPEAVLDDGLLDLFIVSPVSRIRLLRVFPKVFAGAHTHLPEVLIERVREVSIDSEGIVGYADGERIGPLPVTVTVVPGALTMYIQTT